MWLHEFNSACTYRFVLVVIGFVKYVGQDVLGWEVDLSACFEHGGMQLYLEQRRFGSVYTKMEAEMRAIRHVYYILQIES